MPGSLQIFRAEHSSIARGSSKASQRNTAAKMLVWFEPHENMYAAIVREKQIKAGNRAKKLALIEALNPHWRDLYENLT
jgi:putative endonuclease